MTDNTGVGDVLLGDGTADWVGTPEADNGCVECSAAGDNPTYCPGGTDAPVYILNIRKSSAPIGDIIFSGYVSASAGYCSDSANCKAGGSSVLTNFDLSSVTRPGYTFANVMSSIGSGQKVITDNRGNITDTTFYKTINANTTLYMEWTPNVFRAGLDSKYYATSSTSTGSSVNITSAAPTPLYIKYNTGVYSDAATTTAITELTTLPAKTGYAFQGFYSGKAGTGTKYINANGTFTSALKTATTSTGITLYAHYTPVCIAHRVQIPNANMAFINSNYTVYMLTDDTTIYKDANCTQTMSASDFNTMNTTLTQNMASMGLGRYQIAGYYMGVTPTTINSRFSTTMPLESDYLTPEFAVSKGLAENAYQTIYTAQSRGFLMSPVTGIVSRTSGIAVKGPATPSIIYTWIIRKPIATTYTTLQPIADATGSVTGAGGSHMGGWEYVTTCPDNYTLANAGTYNATCRANSFSVVYDGNGATGGSAPSEAPTTCTVGSSCPVGGISYTRIGYQYARWICTSAELESSVILLPGQMINTTVSGDVVTCKPDWAPNEYVVRFNANGGSGSMDDQAFTYDAAQALTQNAFTRTHYDFKGWSTSSTASNATYTDKQSVSNLTAINGEKVTLYAVWAPKVYLVTIDLNGATGGSFTYNGSTYQYSATLGALPCSYGTNRGTLPAWDGTTQNNLTKTNMVFTGWSGLNSDGEIVCDGNKTISAQWVAPTCTANTTSVSGSSLVNVTNNAPVCSCTSKDGYYCARQITGTAGQTSMTISANAANDGFFALSGYVLPDACPVGTFSNKSSAATGCIPCPNGRTTADQATKYNATATNACTVTCSNNANVASWETTSWTTPNVASNVCTVKTCNTGYSLNSNACTAITYTVKFNANGGSGSMNNQDFTYGVTQELFTNAFTRTGYTFEGWSTSSTATTATYTDKHPVSNLSKTNGATVNLYAVWSINSYDCAKGNYLPANSVTCSSCPAGYYCTGGTYTFNASADQGLTGICESGYSTGGATTSTCTACTYGSATGTAASNHDAVNDCKKTITLSKNGGSGTLTVNGTSYTGTNNASITCSQGAACNFSNASGLSQTGYTFNGGWGSLASCTSTTTSFINPGSSTYYACKTPINYPITYNLNDGTLPSDAVTSYNITQTVTLPIPTHANGTFAGWYASADFSGTAVTQLSGTTGNKTYYAKWTCNTGYSGTSCTPNTTGRITLEDRNGVLQSGQFIADALYPDSVGVAPGSIKITYNNAIYNYNTGARITKLTTKPYIRVYTFGGFYTSPQCSGDQMIDANGNFNNAALTKYPTAGATATWYACYQGAPYTVTFDPNKPDAASSAISGSMADQTFYYDAYQDLALNNYKLTGYTFAGWNTAADGSGTAYEDGQNVRNLTTESSITLYAQWTLKKYTITIDKNGGSGKLTVNGTTATGVNDVVFTCSYGDTFTLPAYSNVASFTQNNMTRDLHVFNGWSQTGTISCNGNKTITANWTKLSCVAGTGVASTSLSISNNVGTCSCSSTDGYYCSSQIITPSGTTTTKTVNATPAPNGHFALAGATESTACAKGSYSTKSSASSSCTACPAGYTTSGTGTNYSSSPNTVCTVACTNNANVYGWVDKDDETNPLKWTNNKVNNLCVIKTCQSTYVKTDNTCSKCSCIKGTGVKMCTVTGSSDDTTQCEYSFTCNDGYGNGIGTHTSSGAVGVAANTMSCDASKQTVHLKSDYYKNETTTIEATTDADPSTLYYKFESGVYSDSNYTTKITKLTTLPKLENTCYSFQGFYHTKNPTALMTPLIDKEGNINQGLTVHEFSTIYSDSSLYAHYIPTSMTIKYEPGDGFVAEPESGSIAPFTSRICSYTGVAAGSCPASTADDFDFYKHGYTFTGWRCTGGGDKCDGDIYAPGADLSDANDGDCGTITLTALWSPNTFTVRFMSGNTLMASQEYTYDAEQALKSISTMEQPVDYLTGWEFVGWSLNPNTTTPSFTDGEVISNLTQFNSSVPLYGIWKRDVSFKYYNGATATTTTTSKRTQYYRNTNTGTAAVTDVNTFDLVASTTYGWEPIGWVLNNTTGTTATSNATTASEKVTPSAGTFPLYYALYSRPVTLSYVANGATGGSMQPTNGTQYFNTGSTTAKALSLTLADNAFTKTGYTFKNWDIAKTEYADGASVDFPNTQWTTRTNVQAVAQWTANTYAVKFNANGGSGTMNNQSFKYAAAQNLTANAFTNAGKEFKGWATSASGSVAYADKANVINLTSTANGTVNLYAVWASCPAGKYCPSDKLTPQDCPANSYCTEGSATPISCTTLGGGLYKNSNAGSTKAENCYITTTGGYYVADADDTTQTKCGDTYYCPSTTLYWNTTGGRNACPAYADHKPTAFPDNFYDSTLSSGNLGGGSAVATQMTECVALNWMSNTRGKLYSYAKYNATTGKYDNWTTYGWADAHAGYYLTTKGTCGAYAYYKEALPCPEGSYCPGKARVSCNSSNSATVHTTTFGLNSCAADTTHYTLSAEKSTSINACYLTTESKKYVATAGAGQVTCLAGGACPGGTTVYYNESNKGRTTCANWKFAGSGAASCSSCPTLTSGWSKNDSTSTGWTTYTQCQQTQKPANCASGAIIQTATSSTAWGESANKTALSATANYYASTTSCPACSSLGGGLYNTSAAGNTGGASACKATVPAGSYLKAATDTEFLSCPVGSYCPGVTLSYSNVGGATACSGLGTGYTSDGGTTMTKQENCYLTVSGGNVRNGTSGTTLAQCAAGTFKAEHKAYYGTSYSCENCTGRTQYSAKGASACKTVSSGYYTTGCTSNNKCTGQSQCTGATYCASGVQNNCPTAESNWTQGTGNGWTAVTQCFETRNATNISTYCNAGQIKKNATTSKTWPTSATISVAFQAKAGSIVAGQTCTPCTGATFSAGGTATECSACNSNYQANTESGKSAAGQCQTLCSAGTAVLTENNACATIQNSTYKGKYTTEHLVNYGSKTEIQTCPAYYQDGNGTTAQSNCINACSAGTQVASANADCTTPNTANWYTDAHNVTYGKTSSNMSKVIACATDKGYGNSGTSASNHAGSTSCKTTCAAGKMVLSANAACSTPNNTTYGASWYTAQHTVAYGSTSKGLSLVNSCPTSSYVTPNNTTQSNHDASTDCTITCAPGTVVASSNANCTTPSGSWYSEQHTVVAGNTSSSTQKQSCVNGYATPNTTTQSNHDASTDCTITCGPGEYIATAKGLCENVGAGYYFAGGKVSQGSTNTRGQCTAPLTTIGYGYGANEADDCGRILHAGNNTIYLRSEKRSSPSLRVKVGDQIFYGALSTSLQGALKVKKDNTQYSVVNDWQ